MAKPKPRLRLCTRPIVMFRWCFTLPFTAKFWQCSVPQGLFCWQSEWCLSEIASMCLVHGVLSGDGWPSGCFLSRWAWLWNRLRISSGSKGRSKYFLPQHCLALFFLRSCLSLSAEVWAFPSWKRIWPDVLASDQLFFGFQISEGQLYMLSVLNLANAAPGSIQLSAFDWTSLGGCSSNSCAAFFFRMEPGLRQLKHSHAWKISFSPWESLLSFFQNYMSGFHPAAGGGRFFTAVGLPRAPREFTSRSGFFPMSQAQAC